MVGLIVEQMALSRAIDCTIIGENVMRIVQMTLLAITLVIALTFSTLVHHSLDGANQILETKISELKR